MIRELDRNARCSCGSGRKYKNCCGKPAAPAVARRKTGLWLLLAAVALVALLGFRLLRQGGAPPPGAAPPGKVWSPEHGHWHDAP